MAEGARMVSRPGAFRRQRLARFGGAHGCRWRVVGQVSGQGLELESGRPRLPG